jgi:hypothetical protein
MNGCNIWIRRQRSYSAKDGKDYKDIPCPGMTGGHVLTDPEQGSFCARIEIFSGDSLRRENA